MSDTWDSSPLAPAAPPTPSPVGTWDAAPLASPSAQQKGVASATDNSEEAAKAIGIAKRTGIPAPVVQSDLPGYDAHDKQQAAIKATQNPALAKYIDSNPMAASVSADDWDKLDEASQTLQALHPELVRGRAQVGLFQGIPEIADMLTTAPGREKLYAAAKALPAAIGQGILDFIETPGKVASGEISLATEEGLNKAIGFGIGVAFGTGGAKGTIRTGRPEAPTGLTSFDDFMHTLEGMRTRKEIDDFLASKQPGPPGATLQIEHAKAGSAALDAAVEVAQDSKTKVRSPEMYADMVRAHDPGNVHIDAAKIMELYQKEGKIPAEGDGLFGFVPDLAHKVQAAAATGGEITIPIADYTAHIDPAIHKDLRESARLHNDGVTLEEAKEAEKSIEAYHGTPHNFERFDLTKIGTGEGAQVYGHGLYFAENRAVSEEYRKQLSGGTVIERVDGKFGARDREGDDLGLVFETREEAEVALGQGQLYKVSIAADPTHFLDWDKPLNEQTEHVQQVLKTLGITDELSNTYINKQSGEEIYQRLSKGEEMDRQANASRTLAEAGIPGIKYLDQGSRGRGTPALQKELDALKKLREEIIDKV